MIILLKIKSILYTIPHTFVKKDMIPSLSINALRNVLIVGEVNVIMYLKTDIRMN